MAVAVAALPAQPVPQAQPVQQVQFITSFPILLNKNLSVSPIFNRLFLIYFKFSIASTQAS